MHEAHVGTFRHATWGIDQIVQTPAKKLLGVVLIRPIVLIVVLNTNGVSKY